MPITKTTPPIFALFHNPLVELGATQIVLTADCTVSHSVSTLRMTVSQEIYTIITKAFPATSTDTDTTHLKTVEMSLLPIQFLHLHCLQLKSGNYGFAITLSNIARPAVTPATLKRLLPILLLGEQRHNGCEQFA